jgi:hypothetical protein
MIVWIPAQKRPWCQSRCFGLFLDRWSLLFSSPPDCFERFPTADYISVVPMSCRARRRALGLLGWRRKRKAAVIAVRLIKTPDRILERPPVWW